MRISKSTKTAVKASCNSGDYKQCLKDALVAKGGYRKSDVEDQSTATLESWAKDAGIDVDNVCACGDVKASKKSDVGNRTADFIRNRLISKGYTKEEVNSMGLTELKELADKENIDIVYSSDNCNATTSTDKALQHIKAAIDILGKSGKKDDVTMDSIANLATVMFDMNSSKSDR